MSNSIYATVLDHILQVEFNQSEGLIQPGANIFETPGLNKCFTSGRRTDPFFFPLPGPDWPYKIYHELLALQKVDQTPGAEGHDTCLYHYS